MKIITLLFTLSLLLCKINSQSCNQQGEVCVRCKLGFKYVEDLNSCERQCPAGYWLDTSDPTNYKCVKKYSNLYNIAEKNFTCPEHHFTDISSCQCDECLPCQKNMICPPSKNHTCLSQEECCCPAPYKYWVDKQGNRYCEDACPVDYCEYENVCIHVDDMKCAAGYSLDKTKAPQCCVPCQDPCCMDCSDDFRKCKLCSASIKNPQITDQPLPRVGNQHCHYDKVMPYRQTLDNCSCCKEFSEQCHCQYCQNDVCHQQNQNCPICPIGSYEMFEITQGKIVQGKGVCDTCHSNCQACFGPGADQCVRCSPDGTFNKIHGTTCVDKCPSGFFESCCHINYQKCNCQYDGTYPGQFNDPWFFSSLNSTNSEGYKYCEQCNELCSSCWGPGFDQCLTCNNQIAYKVGNSTCVRHQTTQLTN